MRLIQLSHFMVPVRWSIDSIFSLKPNAPQSTLKDFLACVLLTAE